jgi:iron complex transport system substrate-binding protein
VWHDPLITAGPDTFVDDLITLAGGINIAGDSKTSYPEISLEVVIQKDPQIFIYSHHGNSRQEIEQIYSRQNWQDISAIKNKRVYIIDQNLVQRATPRLIDGLEELAKMLHPDLF